MLDSRSVSDDVKSVHAESTMRASSARNVAFRRTGAWVLVGNDARYECEDEGER